MRSVLIVEDELNILKLMSIRLQNENFNVFCATNGIEALEILEKKAINIVLIDIMMPRMDGFALLQIIRSSGNNIPVIMVSSRFGISDKEKAFALKADDYMVKPIDHRELILRIEALLRRFQIASDHKIIIGKTILNNDNFTVENDKRKIALPKKEFLILFKLLSHLNVIFTKHQLIHEFWGFYSESDDATIKVHINRIRKKIKFFDNIDIITVRGLGYKGVSYETKS